MQISLGMQISYSRSDFTSITGLHRNLFRDYLGGFPEVESITSTMILWLQKGLSFFFLSHPLSFLPFFLLPPPVVFFISPSSWSLPPKNIQMKNQALYWIGINMYSLWRSPLIIYVTGIQPQLSPAN